MQYSKPKGTADIYGQEVKEWVSVESQIRALCESFGIHEIRTPMYEYEDLFRRGVGETTDIVQKEMFTFTDAGGRGFALRPEGTAGVVRAFIENGMSSLPMPLKLFYIAPVFRAEKPQKGRYRQHHQFGVEYLGAYGPECDAELISVAHTLLKRLGISDTTLHINSLGGLECRQRYNEELKKFLGKNTDKLCPLCRERFNKNPLRVLDCKNESCKTVILGAPTSISVLGGECLAHFEGVQKALADMDIDFIVNPALVRGLDYYTRTVFEFVSADLGAQSSVCGGGRYDGLVKDCGGPDTAAIGFGMGIDRILLILAEQGIKYGKDNECVLYVGYMGDGKSTATRLVYNLRKAGISAEYDLCQRSVKAQMKHADKLNARYSMIIGDNEAASGTVSIKDMRGGETVVLSIDGVVKHFTNHQGGALIK